MRFGGLMLWSASTIAAQLGLYPMLCKVCGLSMLSEEHSRGAIVGTYREELEACKPVMVQWTDRLPAVH